MNDLIDRQALLDDFKTVNPDFKGWAEWASCIIQSQPSAQQWIPCSERLPERNGVYMVTRTISDGFEYGNIADACYFNSSDIWHDDTRVNHGRKYLADVIAWMPLPEPYKGGDNDDDQ